jgi:hypothetical protein
MSIPTPPESFLNIPFGAVKDDIAKAADAADAVLQFLTKYSWLVPPQYKPLLDELTKLLAGFDKLLGKNP